MKLKTDRWHRAGLISSQAAVIVAAYFGAFLLRFDGLPPEHQFRCFWQTLPVLLTTKLVVFWLLGVFRGWWRFFSLNDAMRLLKANVVATAVFLAYVVLVPGITGYSRTVFFLDFALCVFALGGLRLFTRAFMEGSLLPRRRQGQRVLVVGAGHAGQMLVREMRKSRNLGKIPIGFLDDDRQKVGRMFEGLPVLAELSSLAEVVKIESVGLVVIALPSATGRKFQFLIDECHKCGVGVNILPALSDLFAGKITVVQLRQVKVEDLLGRHPVSVDHARVARKIEGQVICVTGAGGSIGSEICRQVASCRPGALVLFERCELNLYNIQRKLSEKFPSLRLVPVIGDVQDETCVTNLIREHKPSLIYHAAAYKHVPLMELSVREAVKNNVLGTRTVMRAAVRHGVGAFILISSDKAVYPSSIMGASKRAAELLLQTVDPERTTLAAVRFGNVLKSSGSVVPIFEEQIEAGGPVTVTHPDIVRYFMTIPEATGLVLQAANMARGGEIFVLDMGEPIRILNLAKTMIRLAGLDPEKDIEIRFTGLRPGEKLREELATQDAGIERTEHKRIFVIREAGTPPHTLITKLDCLIEAALSSSNAAVLSALKDVVPEFAAQENRAGLRSVAPVSVCGGNPRTISGPS